MLIRQSTRGDVCEPQPAPRVQHSKHELRNALLTVRQSLVNLDRCGAKMNKEAARSKNRFVRNILLAKRARKASAERWANVGSGRRAENFDLPPRKSPVPSAETPSVRSPCGGAACLGLVVSARSSDCSSSTRSLSSDSSGVSACERTFADQDDVVSVDVRKCLESCKTLASSIGKFKAHVLPPEAKSRCLEQERTFEEGDPSLVKRGAPTSHSSTRDFNITQHKGPGSCDEDFAVETPEAGPALVILKVSTKRPFSASHTTRQSRETQVVSGRPPRPKSAGSRCQSGNAAAVLADGPKPIDWGPPLQGEVLRKTANDCQQKRPSTAGARVSCSVGRRPSGRPCSAGAMLPSDAAAKDEPNESGLRPSSASAVRTKEPIAHRRRPSSFARAGVWRPMSARDAPLHWPLRPVDARTARTPRAKGPAPTNAGSEAAWEPQKRWLR